jgi:hypothetical protein
MDENTYKIVDCFRVKTGYLMVVLDRERKLLSGDTEEVIIDGKQYHYQWQHMLAWIGIHTDEAAEVFIGKTAEIIQQET